MLNAERRTLIHLSLTHKQLLHWLNAKRCTLIYLSLTYKQLLHWLIDQHLNTSS